jgi:hypothetical protein
MKKYLTGFICGILVGAAGSVFAARIVGGNGYLMKKFAVIHSFGLQHEKLNATNV